MGLRDYFRTKKQKEPQSSGDGTALTEKAVQALPLPPPPAILHNHSGANSSSALVSSRSSAIIDDVKHEVMVSYLYKQQCANMWVDPTTADECEEGVLLRKSRHNNIACPPALANGIFADAFSTLNVQVRLPLGPEKHTC